MRTRNKVTNIVILPGITSGFIRKLEIIHNEGLCCPRPLFIIGNCSLSQLFVWQKIQSSIFVRAGEDSGLFPSSYFMFESPFYYKISYSGKVRILIVGIRSFIIYLSLVLVFVVAAM